MPQFSPPGPRSRRIRIAATVAMMAAIFAVDTFTPLKSAVATLYIVALILLTSDYRPVNVLRWGLACAALTVIAFLAVHGDWDDDISSVLRMVFSLAAIGVATLLIRRAQHTYSTLQRSEQRYRTTFNTVAVAICEYDFRPVAEAVAELRARGVSDIAGHLAAHPDTVERIRRSVRLADVNHTALRLFGFPDAAGFRQYRDEFLPGLGPRFADCILAVAEGRGDLSIETRVERRDGQLLDVIVAFSLDAGSALDRVPCSMLDVTERRRLGAAVEEARGRLERAHRATVMAQVSASIAHEINQPLSAIRSYAGAAHRWLSRPEPDLGEVNTALTAVVASVQRADEVIRRIRAITGKPAAETSSRIGLDGLLAEVPALVAGEAARHGGSLVVSPAAPGAEITGDRILLQQVLINLVSNAFQAMDGQPGPRRVEIATARRPEGAVIEVRDTGPGLPEDFAARAFEPFQTTKPDGMGVGLAICESVVERHGGRLTLTSAPGQGATARVTLPLAGEEACAPPAATEPASA
ncbi:sensor histidine kinase [Oceanicella sp. SM1341]|uniref:sensor histidine kinase n=1 Tax=Oceanicella sp. SM1341 TaxID=1548889 RepID=UPI000E50E2D4|nr:ATP-binding protein [Oceanicella sp. SM1341]